MKKILILGGGFAGVECAIYLRKNNFFVTLISDREFLYVYPTSIWVPIGSCSYDDVKISLKELENIHDFTLIIDKVESIKSLEKKVYCSNETYDYEYLVVAMGSGKMHHIGLEHTLSICGEPKDALRIKEKFDSLIEKSSGKVSFGFGSNPKDSSNVRGGPAFELLFNFHNKLKCLGIRDSYELTFFAPMKEPGKRMGRGALKMMDKIFKKLDIKVRVGKKIVEFKENGVLFEDDTFLESDFTMFIPAGDGHKVFQNSDLPLSDSGLIKINDYCEVYERDNIFAIGDCVFLEGPNWKAKQGHLAEAMAKVVAHNIKAKDKKNPNLKGYQEHINILCIMDTGNGASFVYRSEKRAFMIPMPIVGHWLKKGWGFYYKNSKLNKIPRLPGL